MRDIGRLACLLITMAARARADVRLPAIFSDHMVLQANAAAPVWGWADPGEEVSVSVGDQTLRTATGADGKWMVKLAPMKTSDAATLTVRGKNTLIVSDVLIGEVWLCSGQSNMGFSVGRATHGAEEAATADFPRIRFFTLGPAGTTEPRDDAPGKWEVCSPAVAIRSSAVGFFYARGLHQELKVPIGIIHSSVGGTPIENWISREALDGVPGYKERTEAKLALMKSQAEDAKRFPGERDRWEERNGVKPPANEGAAKGWADPAFDDHDWKTIALPSKWADSMGMKQGGVFWLRKEVTFPETTAGQPFRLILNYMHEQYNATYFNGVEIGHTGDQPPYFYMGERSYDVPGKLVKAGRNVIAVRVVCANPRADLMGRGARGDYNLPIDQKLVGNQWRCQVESLFPPLTAEALKSRPKVNASAIFDTPVILYNAMIHPLIPYGIRGVVWYQGESNTGRSPDYHRLFPLLIEDWRRRWGQGDFPFYYVQIANFGDAPTDPNQKSGWAEIRDVQAKTMQTEPNTGMAVIIDADDGQNMHPKNKLPVGERLTRIALARTYGDSIEDSGPTYDSMRVEGAAIRIEFQHHEGLVSKGGAPKWFAIAGADRKFVWAEARIEGKSVVVSSPELKEPVAVRYCWCDNPVRCDLYNGAGLPAAPFRTDDWP